MKSFQWFILMLIPLMALTSCSGSNNPTVPQINSDNQQSSDKIAPASENYTQSINRGVFGVWEIHINKKNLTAEIIPARKAVSIGHIFDADLQQFLTVSPCANCMWVSSLRFADNLMYLDVKIKHPFADIVKRPDLHAFDVRTIFLANPPLTDSFGIDMMKSDGATENVVAGNSLLLNPDGYTSHHTDIIHDSRYFIVDNTITGNIFPYLRYFDDSSTADFDPNAPVGHNVMPVGSSVDTKSVVFDLENFTDEMTLYVIADMAYGQSATFVNRTSPHYYLPAFNRTEPWRVEYWTENNNLDYSVTGSKANLIVQVFDWQHSAEVDPNYPDPANLDGVKESSKVTQVEVMFPGLMTGKLTSTSPLSGDGSPTNPLKYMFQIENQTGGPHFNYGFLAARDEMYGQAAPIGRNPIPESPSGFPYETDDIRDYSLYQLIYVNIPYADGKAVDFNGELDVDWPTSYESNISNSFEITANLYSDIGATKYQYDWDFDYDGSTFDLDGSGIPSPAFTVATTGRHIVGLRVTTNSVPPHQYIYSVPVNVRGMNFDSTFGGNFDEFYRTSLAKEHSVAVTDDRYYVAYTSKKSGRWNIMVTVFELDGTSHTHHVTNATDSNYLCPSLIAVEDEGYEGLHVTFSKIPDGFLWDAYSSFGNLDGGGFLEGNIKPVSTDPPVIEYLSQLIFFKGDLYAFYSSVSMAGATVYVCKSTDMGLTWTGHSQVDPGAQLQYRYSTATIGDCVEVVYENAIDYTNRGFDLYIARSAINNPLTYGAGELVSTLPGKMHDTDPSICVLNDTTYIAYLSREDSSSVNTVHVATIKDDVTSDHEIRNRNSFDMTTPCVSVLNERYAVVAYGARNTNNDANYAVILRLFMSHPYGSFSEFEISAIAMGNLGGLDYPINPGVASINRNGVGECFVALTDFTSGIDTTGVPASDYFGDLRTISHIVAGNF